MLNLTTSVLHNTILGDADWKRPEIVKQYGINYRSSSLVIDEDSCATEARKVSAYGGGTGLIFAGDRAPDTTGLFKVETRESTRLFNLFGPTHHTVLIFAETCQEIFRCSPPLSEKYPENLVHFFVIQAAGSNYPKYDAAVEVIEDTDGHAYKIYHTSQDVNAIFIIRPDGYVGARVTGLDGISRYFDKIFGGHF